VKVKIITLPCPSCRKADAVVIDATDEQLDAYNKGALIQVAFPHVSIDIREQIITGYHAKCWNKMWS